jgi:isoquinoline 1-oxidoreductase beta subunit
MTATRREFVRLTLLGGAALTIGFGFEQRGGPQAGPKAFSPNAWITIDSDDTITLTVGKSEMGQGVRTSLPMILAEELEAEWGQIRLVQAKPSAGFTRLGTGGSWSVGGSWKPLRQAGATARVMLVAAAAANWSVEPAECRAERGAIIHIPTGRRLRYGELVTRASAMPLPPAPALKTIDSFRLIGQPVRRFDGPAIVTGKASYGIDSKPAGMHYASVVRPPVIGGRVVRFDAATAKSVKGVSHVVRIGSGVAVVADRTWSAIKGREALRVEFDDGGHGDFSSHSHYARLTEASRQPGFVMRREGGGLADLPSAARKVEATYIYPFYAHAPVEPMNCVASVRQGQCEIWAPTQAPNRLQERVAALLGIAREAVTVNVTLIGGGFGRRLNVDYAIEAAEISRAVGAPVQVLWSRADDMQHGHFQSACLHQLTGGLDGQGRPVVWSHKKVSSFHNLDGKPKPEELDVAYYQDSAWGVYDIPYNIPAIETSFVAVDTHVPIGPWRAVYSPSSTFARESFLDELAVAGGHDPLQLRLDLLGGTDIVKAGALTIDRARMRQVLEVLRERSGWGSPLPDGHGRGVACNVYDGETHLAYTAEVSVRDGKVRVHRVVAVIDCGVVINPLGIEAQIEGGVIWGLSSALKGEITFSRGRVEQSSYRDFDVLRMNETPSIEVHMIPSHGEQPFGAGEPPVPPIVPAVINAIFAASGKRIRRLPITADQFRSS